MTAVGRGAPRQSCWDVYRAQEHLPDGFDDWGKFTAHVVHAQRVEIERLRGLLRDHGTEPGEWDDSLHQ